MSSAHRIGKHPKKYPKATKTTHRESQRTPPVAESPGLPLEQLSTINLTTL